MSGLRNVVVATAYLYGGYQGAVHVTAPIMCEALGRDPVVRNYTKGLREEFCPDVKPVPVDAGTRDVRLALPARIMEVKRTTRSGYDQERKLAGISVATADSQSYTETTGWLMMPSYSSVLGQETAGGKRVFNGGGSGIDVSTLRYVSSLAIPIPDEIHDVFVGGCGAAADVTGNGTEFDSCRREGVHATWNNDLPMFGADRDENVGQRQRALSAIAEQDISCMFRYELEPALIGPKLAGAVDKQRDTEVAAMILRTHVRVTDYFTSNGKNLPWNTDVPVRGQFDVGPTPSERYDAARATDPALPANHLTEDDFCLKGGSEITIPEATLNVYKALGGPVVNASYDLHNSDFLSVIANYGAEG